jgi:hypothetical protein
MSAGAVVRELRPRREPVTYSESSVLTIKQVADWLQVSVRQAERLRIPCFYLGTRTRRYLGKSVLEYLEEKID